MKSLISYSIIAFLFIFFNPRFLLAQEKGYFNIRNFTSQEYNANSQNWSIIQDKRGVMYFGNTDSLIRYDGVSWEPIKNVGVVRSLAMNENGNIFVGGSGDFGYLRVDKRGFTRFESLLSKVDSADRKIQDVWRTYCIGNDVYFSTFKTLFRLRNGKIKTWKTANKFYSSFVVNGKLYIENLNIGIQQVTEDSLVSVPFGDFFKDKSFWVSIPLENNKMIIGTKSFGIFVYDFSKIDKAKEQEDVISKFETEADTTFTKSTLYSGVQLKDGNFAFGTLNSGTVIVDQNGKLINTLNLQSGLKNQIIWYCYQDREQNLWLATNNGISRVDMSSPLSFCRNYEIKSTILDIVRFDETLYLAAGIDGLLSIKNNKVSTVRTNAEFRCFLDFVSPDDNSKHILLAGTKANGICEINGLRVDSVIGKSDV